MVVVGKLTRQNVNTHRTKVANATMSNFVIGTPSSYLLTENPANMPWNELLILDGGSQLCTFWHSQQYCVYSYVVGYVDLYITYLRFLDLTFQTMFLALRIQNQLFGIITHI
jgi:hypothetical protein